MKMSEETRKLLLDKGRNDLVETYDIIQSGYAGVKSTGEIVDRRIDNEAAPMRENSLLGIPPAKKLEP